MTTEQVNAKKLQLAQLKGKGLNQRQIAKELGVTIRTASNWYKCMPLYHYEVIQSGMLKRLQALSKNPNTPAMDIYNLTNALASIEKTLQRYKKGK
jgi:Homeodomain-like domain